MKTDYRDTVQFAISVYNRAKARLQKCTDAYWDNLEQLNESVAAFGADSLTAESDRKRERVAKLELRLAEEAYATACEFSAALLAEKYGTEPAVAVSALVPVYRVRGVA